MRIKEQHFPPLTLLLLTVLLSVIHAVAQQDSPKEKILVSFKAGGSVGNTPNGVLISDAAGNLYGVNTYGGLGSGALYELSPTAQGGWTAKSIYVFPTEVFFPGGLVMDSSGNLYGTEFAGGTETCQDNFGDYNPCGAVYELSPDGSGGWSEKTIWNASQMQGWEPSSLSLDAAGNLYGTTVTGGGGTVFELQRKGENWTHTVLHAFGQPGPDDDGGEPQGPLVFDKDGNIYGATYLGGTNGGGTVFELKKAKGGWQEINLFQFDSFRGEITGYYPQGVIFDSAGNLYGSTSGDVSGGVAFELTPTSTGSWQEAVLKTFILYGPGGYNPGPLVFDSAGNLYGTVYYGTGSEGGDSQGDGALFQLKPSANGTWSEVILHSFPSKTGDGKYPDGLLPDSQGNLYGTTAGGGSAGVGTVFEITP